MAEEQKKLNETSTLRLVEILVHLGQLSKEEAEAPYIYKSPPENKDVRYNNNLVKDIYRRGLLVRGQACPLISDGVNPDELSQKFLEKHVNTGVLKKVEKHYIQRVLQTGQEVISVAITKLSSVKLLLGGPLYSDSYLDPETGDVICTQSYFPVVSLTENEPDGMPKLIGFIKGPIQYGVKLTDKGYCTETIQTTSRLVHQMLTGSIGKVEDFEAWLKTQPDFHVGPLVHHYEGGDVREAAKQLKQVVDESYRQMMLCVISLKENISQGVLATGPLNGFLERLALRLASIEQATSAAARLYPQLKSSDTEILALLDQLRADREGALGLLYDLIGSANLERMEAVAGSPVHPLLEKLLVLPPKRKLEKSGVSLDDPKSAKKVVMSKFEEPKQYSVSALTELFEAAIKKKAELTAVACASSRTPIGKLVVPPVVFRAISKPRSPSSTISAPSQAPSSSSLPAQSPMPLLLPSPRARLSQTPPPPPSSSTPRGSLSQTLSPSLSPLPQALHGKVSSFPVPKQELKNEPIPQPEVKDGVVVRPPKKMPPGAVQVMFQPKS